MTTIDSGSQDISEAGQNTREAEALDQFTRRAFLTTAGAAGFALTLLPAIPSEVRAAQAGGTDPLEGFFQNPDDSSKVWTYWWWLEGAVTKAGITADLEAMKQQGIAGVIVFDCGIRRPATRPRGRPS